MAACVLSVVHRPPRVRAAGAAEGSRSAARAGRTAVAVALLAALAAGQGTDRVSESTLGVEADGNCYEAAISGDGNCVAFYANTFSFEPFNTFGVMVHDRFTLETEFVSLSIIGVPNNGNTGNGTPDLSVDGRYVVFVSDSTNLVPGDGNGTHDVFVRDRLLDTTTLVSASTTGGVGNGQSLAPAISADGKFVAFASTASNLVSGDTNGLQDVFVRDLTFGVTSRVSVAFTLAQPNGPSESPDISADGRYVSFSSLASNLVAADGNPSWDAFVRDRQTATTTVASTSSAGAAANGLSVAGSLSADGRYVGFASFATNLVVGDVNGAPDVFLKDRMTGATSLISVSSGGAQANAASGVWHSSISATGRYVAFESGASNLVPGDTNLASDVFVRDRQLGQTIRVSENTSGAEGDSSSFGQLALSDDGALVVYSSTATNLVDDDLPSCAGSCPNDIDVFVHNRLEETWVNLGFAKAGSAGTPVLTGQGLLEPGSKLRFRLAGALPGAPVHLVAGVPALFAPFKGGTMVPTPLYAVPGVASPAGTHVFNLTWPGAPSGSQIFFQYWIQDVGATLGFAASNGLRGEVP